MSIKEQIAEAVQSEGYDLFSAYEIASGFVKELGAAKPGIYTCSIGKTSFKIKKGKQNGTNK